jgi:hypothetical protein
MLTDFRKTRVPDFHQQNAVVLDRKLFLSAIRRLRKITSADLVYRTEARLSLRWIKLTAL